MVLKVYGMIRNGNAFHFSVDDLFREGFQDKIKEGKATISIKVGKRRKMVNGKIVLKPVLQDYDNFRFYNFIPNSPEKLSKILDLTESWNRL